MAKQPVSPAKHDSCKKVLLQNLIGRQQPQRFFRRRFSGFGHGSGGTDQKL